MTSALRRIVFVNRFYAPDLSATSQMLRGVVERLAARGYRVEVICSRQEYENARAGLPAREKLAGVPVRRLWSTRFGRAGLAGRAMDYASFFASLVVWSLRSLRRGDVVVMKTDPPLLSIPGALVARATGATLVNWLQDVFPEVATRLDLVPMPSRAARWLEAWRDRSLRAARGNVVLGTRMRDYIASRGVDPQRIVVSPNWADEGTIGVVGPESSELRGRLGLAAQFVVAYAGNLGRVHDVDTLLEAAARLDPQGSTRFLMIGGGAGMRVLEREVTARALASFRFIPYQPAGALPDTLAAADVHLVSLHPALEGLIVPSKLYGILAAGRPAVFVGDRNGEVATILREAGCGVSVEWGDGAGLAAALEALRGDPALRLEMGRRARAVFESRYTLAASAARWEQLLDRVSAVSPVRNATVAPPERP